MEQTHPLAELTHKRRLSALGPGGLTRERAGFEVRDVHYSQYGRMCPIETPEGPNIGLITSLACYARVNDLGFVETPYLVVKNGKVTGDVAWLDANREEGAVIAQANAKLNPDATFADELVLCRDGGVTAVTADEIIVDAGPAERTAGEDRRGGNRPLQRLTQLDRYRVKKYWRTNQDTAINQRPVVRLGQRVKQGDVLADGAAT